MKNFQQNLLILLALALCGLCVFQWYEQTAQRDEITTLNGVVYQKNVAIRDATNSIAVLNQQIGQLDSSLTETKANAATNSNNSWHRKKPGSPCSNSPTPVSTNEIARYKTTVDTRWQRS